MVGSGFDTRPKGVALRIVGLAEGARDKLLFAHALHPKAPEDEPLDLIQRDEFSEPADQELLMIRRVKRDGLINPLIDRARVGDELGERLGGRLEESFECFSPQDGWGSCRGSG